MRYIIYITFIISLISCSKIEPQVQKTQVIDKKQVSETSNESCGIASCSFKNDLMDKEYNRELPLPKLKTYEDRFKFILQSYDNKEKLISSQDFQDFTNDLNTDFFGCEGNIYSCKGTQPYGEDSTNYLFYIYIPKLVYESGIESKGWGDSEIESVIQAIKRKDFNSILDKELSIEQYEKTIDKKVLLFKERQIDKEKLLGDLDYFSEIILTPGIGFHDQLFEETYSVKVDWEEDNQLERIMNYAHNSFYKTLGEYGINKEYFIQKLNETYDYNHEDVIIGVINDLESSILELKDSNYYIPTDRYYRNDELFLFQNANENTPLETKKKLILIRHKVLLIFNLGNKEELYELTNRLGKYSFKEKFLLTNFFKYSKYIKVDNTLSY